MIAFDFDTAFSRNQGLFNEQDQASLRNATVGVAGMGGVGGEYVVALARAGIGNFKIADFDCFELANFNRQYGATVNTLGLKKTEVMADILHQINPEIDVVSFDQGLTPDNLNDFLSGCDVVVDAIDLFVPDWHRRLIATAQSQGTPCFAAVPVGFGTGMVGFTAAGMSFDDYFGWRDDEAEERKVLRLALGFAPAGYHVRYIDPSSIDLKLHKGPSSVAGCKLCAGVVSTAVVDAIIDAESIKAAPWFTHFDAKLMKFQHRKLNLGFKNPLQRLKFAVASKRLCV